MVLINKEKDEQGVATTAFDPATDANEPMPPTQTQTEPVVEPVAAPPTPNVLQEPITAPTPAYRMFSKNPRTGEMDKYYKDDTGRKIFKTDADEGIKFEPAANEVQVNTQDTSSMPSDEDFDKMYAQWNQEPLPEGGPMLASLGGQTDVPLDDFSGTESVATDLSEVGGDVNKITEEATSSLGTTVGAIGDVAGVVGGIGELADDDFEVADVKAAAGLAQTGAKVAGAKALEQGIGKAMPILSVAQSISTLADKKSSDVQKIGALATTAGAIAATNFWNPAGWVAGALTIGGTLAQIFGGKSEKIRRSVNIRGHRGGSGYSYL